MAGFRSVAFWFGLSAAPVVPTALEARIEIECFVRAMGIEMSTRTIIIELDGIGERLIDFESPLHP